MALLNKKEFADQTGQTNRSLSVYIGRGKVKVERNDLINTNNEINKAFIASHAWRKPEKNTKEAIAVIESDDDVSGIDLPELPMVGDDGIMSLEQSEKKYKHHLAVKTERAAALDGLRIEKLKGEVIPTAPIEMLIFQYKQHILNQNKLTLQAFLNEIGHKYSISADDMAYYKGYYINLLNLSADEANRSFLDSLGSVLAEFSTKRGVGQKN